MRFPFVSRERLDEAKTQIAELRAEVSGLREQVTELTEEKDALKQELIDSYRIPQELISITPDADLSVIQPMGRPTIASIVAKANRAAASRKPGEVSVSEELAEAAFKGRKQANG